MKKNNILLNKYEDYLDLFNAVIKTNLEKIYTHNNFFILK